MQPEIAPSGAPADPVPTVPLVDPPARTAPARGGPLPAAALEAWSRLRHGHGPGELRAQLLGLVLTPGETRERRCWREDSRALPQLDALAGDLATLPAAARLPALEAVLARCAALPLDERQRIAPAVRRVMCADGRVGPLDRLTLLLIRQRLSGRHSLQRGISSDDASLHRLPLPLRQAAADLSACLARLVPRVDPAARVGTAGLRWHAEVVQELWGGAADAPPCHVPDHDRLVQCLHMLQTLDWMRRPLLLRAWLDALQRIEPAVALERAGADALRVAAGLLDVPLPPDLARSFSELPEQA